MQEGKDIKSLMGMKEIVDKTAKNQLMPAKVDLIHNASLVFLHLLHWIVAYLLAVKTR